MMSHTMTQNHKESLIGIDEAGRGPLAGPITIGIVQIAPQSLTYKQFQKMLRHPDGGYCDSKQLTPEKRTEIFEKIRQAKKDNTLDFFVTSINSSVIDTQGLSYAINQGIERGLRKCTYTEKTKILLDGGLHAPQKYSNQETFVSGDRLHVAIALASICAKVTRDVYMIRQDKVFPEYGFKKHKGYGTVEHRKKIQKYGFSPLHRKSFCENIKIFKKKK